eukprot:9485436-Pyramimonas_sp.AAC.1
MHAVCDNELVGPQTTGRRVLAIQGGPRTDGSRLAVSRFREHLSLGGEILRLLHDRPPAQHSRETSQWSVSGSLATSSKLTNQVAYEGDDTSRSGDDVIEPWVRSSACCDGPSITTLKSFPKWAACPHLVQLETKVGKCFVDGVKLVIFQHQQHRAPCNVVDINLELRPGKQLSRPERVSSLQKSKLSAQVRGGPASDLQSVTCIDPSQRTTHV